MTRTPLALLAFLSLLGATPAAAPDPYQIYAHARAVWESQRYPAYLSYVVVVNVDDKGVQKANHYRATFDSIRDRIYINVVSDEERTDPHIPDGVNLSIDPKRQFRTLFKQPVGRREDAVDYLGVPMLAPNYSFGIAPFVPDIATSQPDQAALVQEVRKEFNDPLPAQQAQELANAGGLKEIGRVTSVNRDYVITYDDIETLDGRDAYHLSLRPSHRATRLRLREMWIDTQTFATLEVETQGNFANDSVPWVITFASIDGAAYIATEEAQQPVRVGPHTYDRATITFQTITAQAASQRTSYDQLTPETALLQEPPL